jgi:CRISPR/Cas system CSM-associated protein Csm5 (group 7 of RAMP superfamily)
MADNGNKLTVRADDDLLAKIDKIVKERQIIDPKFDKSKLVRELIQNYEMPDASSLINSLVKYAVHYNIPLSELKGAIGTAYRISEIENKKQSQQ